MNKKNLYSLSCAFKSVPASFSEKKVLIGYLRQILGSVIDTLEWMPCSAYRKRGWRETCTFKSQWQVPTSFIASDKVHSFLLRSQSSALYSHILMILSLEHWWGWGRMMWCKSLSKVNSVLGLDVRSGEFWLPSYQNILTSLNKRTCITQILPVPIHLNMTSYLDLMALRVIGGKVKYLFLK